MTQNTQSCDLQGIRHSVDVAISQVAIYNLYVDEQCNDSHLSNCLLSLQSSLKDISTRLHQFEQSAAANEGGATNGN